MKQWCAPATPPNKRTPSTLPRTHDTHTHTHTDAKGGGELGVGRSFNPAAPDGPYELDLAVAAERAVAVALAEMDVAAATDLMRRITVDGRVRRAREGAEGETGGPGCGR